MPEHSSDCSRFALSQAHSHTTCLIKGRPGSRAEGMGLPLAASAPRLSWRVSCSHRSLIALHHSASKRVAAHTVVENWFAWCDVRALQRVMWMLSCMAAGSELPPHSHPHTTPSWGGVSLLQRTLGHVIQRHTALLSYALFATLICLPSCVCISMLAPQSLLWP